MNAKWKRLVTAILMMALLLGPIVSMQTPARAADGEDDNTFIVGFDAEFPPYGYKDDNGEYVGFDLDLAQEVCDRNGWTLKKQPIEWNSKDMELNSGSISCIWNGFTMNGREDDYTWTKPYVDNSQVVVVRKDSGITQLNDLSGKVVAVQADSSALAALTGEDASEENKALCETFKDLQQVGDYNSAFMNLESGAVNAICMDIGVANYEIESRGDKFMMLEDRLSSEEYGIGFKKGNTELRDKVQATLLDMLADGTFDEIAKKWELEESICLTADDEVQEETTADDNTFVVGFDAEFPPYGYKNDDGEYVGFDLDLAQEVCDRNGWILKKQPIEWNSKDMELNSGSISCIWNGFTMNGREDAYTWTTPYVDNSQVVVVRKDSGITQLTDLSGKVVAVQADSSALAALTGEDASEENKALAETFKELQQVGDYNSAFMNLESGAVNAICMDIGVANYEIESRGDKFMMLEDRLSSEEYGIGFKKGNTELRDKVQATLLDMLADGTFEEIAEKWGLEESICLSPDDQVQDGNAAAATATDTTSTCKKNTSFWDKFCSITKQLAEGLLASLVIFFLTLLFSLPLGLLVAAGRMCKIAPIRWLVKFYISIARGTPLMLQLLVVFYGPYYLFGATLTTSYRFQAVIIGFALNYAAYFAEIYRSGIQAVPQGQHEAAKILGYSKSQTFFKIVFPQMAKNILPSVTNEVITLVKDTSLAFAISYTEMFTLAKQVAAAQTTIMPLFIAGVFYYIFNFVVAFVMEKIEKRMNYYH
ncbi:ABC transporter permease subunit [Clostridium sp. AF16-25]|nr:ABC transporter permease subunit [Clostridium sp. AF16-25]RGH04456.1 ABC transporter permease subunit [Clostridium sp. AF15-49]